MGAEARDLRSRLSAYFVGDIPRKKQKPYIISTNLDNSATRDLLLTEDILERLYYIKTIYEIRHWGIQCWQDTRVH